MTETNIPGKPKYKLAIKVKPEFIYFVVAMDIPHLLTLLLNYSKEEGREVVRVDYIGDKEEDEEVKEEPKEDAPKPLYKLTISNPWGKIQGRIYSVYAKDISEVEKKLKEFSPIINIAESIIKIEYIGDKDD